jgi:transmembrane 9 superfamily protein 2/4
MSSWFRQWLISCSFLVIFCMAVEGLFPTMAMKSYREGDEVALDVNVVTSPDSPISYNFYHPPLGTCPYPEKVLKSHGLGAMIFGDRVYSSPFRIQMLRPTTCQVLCQQSLNKQQLSFLIHAIELNYTHNWLIDQLPIAQKIITSVEDGGPPSYRLGFPLGVPTIQDSPIHEVLLHNHYHLTIEFHQTDKKDSKPIYYRVVGASIEPKSLSHVREEGNSSINCPTNSTPQVVRSNMSELEVYYTYSISWIENKELSWATRWDQYLKITDLKIHWYSILMSSFTFLCLTGAVGVILWRNIRLDLIRGSHSLEMDTFQDERSWKSVARDVFRPPRYKSFFCALVGNGTHVLSMAGVTIGKNYS